MDELKVFWTSTAKRQRDHVFEYWNERNNSTSYSKKLNLTIKERIIILKSHSDIGKQTEFENTRSINMGHYSIFYKREGKNIFITGFWDNRQDPIKLLRFLKRKP